MADKEKRVTISKAKPKSAAAPAPASEPGKAENIWLKPVTENQFDNFGKVVGVIGKISKWQKQLTEERRQKIKSLFTVPRNDPDDPFKPNSEIQTKIIAEQPPRKELQPNEEEMLQTIAVNYDYCLPLDIINWPHPLREISNESREQLEKLPSWLKALILLRFDTIVDYFGPRTHLFLRMLANRVDFQRSIPLKIFDIDDNDDVEDYYAIRKEFLVTESDVLAPIIEARFNEKNLRKKDLFRVAHAIALWKLPKSARAEWAPNVVHRSAVSLRQAMLTQASPAEVATVAEDEKMVVLSDEDSDDDDDIYKPPTWQELISDKPEFQQEILDDVERDFNTVPIQFRKLNEDVAPKLKRRRERQRQREKEELERQKLLEEQDPEAKSWKRKKCFKKCFSFRNKRKILKEELQNRGLFRRYSRIWKKNCPMEEIGPTRRRAHHYRYDEGFHAYIVALVASHYFKFFIMLIIVLNAIILAIETSEYADIFVDLFEILDNFFLSVYLTEFLVKVYAHPKRYWNSGFNIFDFIILLVSFIKAISDWLSLAEVQFLRVLVIVRALRILRGVSLNIQIQVLVTAMVETLKTHVLSVMLLLVLLMYICSIVAYYMFHEIIPKDWGNIGTGMLNLFAFVTMDGWTDMNDNFSEEGYVHIGRVFCLIGIVLGNFVFSNIFIAIIIMQISEATDAFRLKQKDDRETVVKRKKETVFRRQKLDMRQLLARQRLSISVDFYYLANQFQRLLRHDDLVDMNEMLCSPMWMDCLNKCSQRCLHTSNVIMNLHRQAADSLLEIYKLYHENKPIPKPIRRARYNRCVRLKTKLTVLKNELYRSATHHRKRSSEFEGKSKVLMVKLPVSEEDLSGKSINKLRFQKTIASVLKKKKSKSKPKLKATATKVMTRKRRLY